MAGPRNVRTLHGNGGRNNDVMGPKEFWLNIPPITRTLFTLAIVMTIVGRLNLINPWYFIYVWNLTFKKVQIWRLLTSCVMLSSRAMPALMELYSIYDRSSQLERGHFGPGLSNRRGPMVTVDYAYYLCFCILAITTATTIIYGSYYPVAHLWVHIMHYIYLVDRQCQRADHVLWFDSCLGEVLPLNSIVYLFRF